MEPDNYPDPIREAIGHGMSRVIQVASSVVTAAQVLAYLGRDHAIARRQNGDAAPRYRRAKARRAGSRSDRPGRDPRSALAG